MRGPAGRKEGALPSALIPPSRRNPRGPPFPPRSGGGEEAAWPGGAASGNTVGGRQFERGCPGGRCPHGPSGTAPASRRPGGTRSPRVLGDPSQGGCEDASFCALYVRGTCISSLFSLCIALGCLRFLFRE